MCCFNKESVSSSLVNLIGGHVVSDMAGCTFDKYGSYIDDCSPDDSGSNSELDEWSITVEAQAEVSIELLVVKCVCGPLVLQSSSCKSGFSLNTEVYFGVDSALSPLSVDSL